ASDFTLVSLAAGIRAGEQPAADDDIAGAGGEDALDVAFPDSAVDPAGPLGTHRLDLRQLREIGGILGAWFDQHHQYAVDVGKAVAAVVEAGAGRDGQPGLRPDRPDSGGNRL